MDERGENWFSTHGGKKIYRDTSNAGQPWKDASGNEIEKRQLLVYFEKQPDRSYGFQKQEYTIQPTTVFSKQRVTPFESLTFVTVIVPYSIKEKAADIAQSLSAQTQDGCSTVQIKNNKEEITVQINMKGSWNVSRK
jgi:hypothetical protein